MVISCMCVFSCIWDALVSMFHILTPWIDRDDDASSGDVSSSSAEQPASDQPPSESAQDHKEISPISTNPHEEGYFANLPPLPCTPRVSDPCECDPDKNPIPEQEFESEPTLYSLCLASCPCDVEHGFDCDGFCATFCESSADLS